jgi:Zn-dependent protease with chaperone function
MRNTTFAVKVVGLLIGFYLLCFGLLGGLLALDVVAIEFADWGGGRVILALLAATVAAFIVVIRGIFVSTRNRKPGGVRVGRADEPMLWQRVTDLANAVGTRAPKTIRLVPQVNAAVWEDSYLLGLIPGKRHMMIGVPLLLGLTPAQLDSVIAHELGHYSGRHTQMGGLVGRTRASVLNAMYAAQGRRRSGKAARVRLPGSDLYAAVFTLYARRVLRVTEAASRLQEYAADRVAAQIAGRTAVTSALRELPVLDAAFDFYVDRFLGAGLGANLLPPPAEALGGFGALLADESRSAELEEIRANPPKAESDPYDSHPPIADRIVAIDAMSDTDRIPIPPMLADPQARAIRLLTNPIAALSSVSLEMLSGELKKGRRTVDWNTLAHSAALHRATERSAELRAVVTRLTGQPAAIAGLIGLAVGGHLPAVLAALPMSDAAKNAASGGRVAREFAKTQLGYQLRAWINLELGSSGRMTWRHDWAQVGGQPAWSVVNEDQITAAIAGATSIAPDFTALHQLVAYAPIGVAA